MLMNMQDLAFPVKINQQKLISNFCMITLHYVHTLMDIMIVTALLNNLCSFK